jgi:hypothetical protein
LGRCDNSVPHLCSFAFAGAVESARRSDNLPTKISQNMEKLPGNLLFPLPSTNFVAY